MWAGRPQRGGLNPSWLPLLICLSPPFLEPALCKLGWPRRGVFVLAEVLTPVRGFSFVPFSQAFHFLRLLATTILDSFFLLYLPNKPMQACRLFNPMCPGACCAPISPVVTVCVCENTEPQVHKIFISWAGSANRHYNILSS